jgi:hypothetical protein
MKDKVPESMKICRMKDIFNTSIIQTSDGMYRRILEGLPLASNRRGHHHQTLANGVNNKLGPQMLSWFEVELVTPKEEGSGAMFITIRETSIILFIPTIIRPGLLLTTHIPVITTLILLA